MFDIELLRRLNGGASMSEADVDQARAAREYEDGGFFEAAKPRHDIPTLTDEQVADLISQEARDAVIAFEVTSRAAYERKYIRPEAPGGASGITIGIGYDVGQMRPADVRAHWAGLIPASDIDLLVTACGLTGAAARARLGEYRPKITVPWDTALEVYKRSTMPSYGRKVLATFPNAVETKGHAFGALFSLVYNRGTKLDGARRVEMAAIRDLMEARAFDKVPAQFRAMRRWWANDPSVVGVAIRRDKEAVLFERGLEVMKQAPILVAAAATGATGAGAPGQFEAYEAAGGSEEDYLGDARFYEEQPVDPSAPQLEAAEPWEKVTWSPDAESPDYSHITGQSQAKGFRFGAREFELLIAANNFQPRRDSGRIVFALRGAILVASETETAAQPKQLDREALTLRDTRPDHKTQRCVIGVYDLTSGRLSGFTASTVPHRRAVYEYKSGGDAGNLTSTGCYSFLIGWHKVGKPTTVPGCLTENRFRKAVWRTRNNLRYDLEDTIENDRSHGDNLHPASNDRSASFSSYGCLVVNGRYICDSADRKKGKHTGEWGEFRSALGLKAPGDGDHGKLFDAVLVTGLEAEIASTLTARQLDADHAEVRAALGRLRQGSRGERVKRLQKALGHSESGVFDHVLAGVLVARQKADFGGKADCIYAPAMEAHFKFGVFDPLAPAPVVVASAQPAAGGRFESVGGDGATLEAVQRGRVEELHYEFGLYTQAARRSGAPAGEGNFESLGEAQLEFGTSMLKAIGANVAQDLETRLKEYVCGKDGRAALIDAAGVKDKINEGAQRGTKALQDALVFVLSPLAVGVPRFLVEKLVGLLVENVVVPAAGPQLDQGCAWLCGQWGENINARYAPGSPPAKPEPQVQTDGAKVEPPVDRRQLAAAASAAPQPPATAAAPAPPPASGATAARIEQMFARMIDAASGAKPDPAGVRHLADSLRDEIDRTGHALTAEQSKTLLDVLSDPRVMNKGQASKVYGLIDDIVATLQTAPIDERTLAQQMGAINAALANPHEPLQMEAAKRLLKALRNARRHEDLSRMADRLLTRDPALLGSVAVPYAQGLIDGGRIVAGADLLHSALQNGRLTLPEEIEIDGLLGRAHKQIYVNFVRTPNDAMALAGTMAQHLSLAADSYGRHYDPARPGENYWLGINLVALLKRAKKDRVEIAAKGDPTALAQGIIDALTPKAATTSDPWELATIGEAYLAIGDNENAARYFGHYANHPKVGAFDLNGTIRQLEEVWQLQAEQAGAGAIVTGLKGALAKKEGGFVTLRPSEQKMVASADRVQFAEHFETLTTDGQFANFAVLKQIVDCGRAVFAVQRPNGASFANHGTAFLVNGRDFFDGALPDRSYLITNAHVMWDPVKAEQEQQGLEHGAVAPGEARILSESDQIDGNGDIYRCAKVIWQSGRNRHDCVLFELDRQVPGKAPLKLAPQGHKLRVADGTVQGTPMSVLGHPGGRQLAVSYVGSIQQNGAVLVDMGPRPESTDPQFLHYTTPTEGGNSGSPVFSTESNTWLLVGLHHAGFDKDAGRPRLSGKPGVNFANEGIWIESIRAAIKVHFTPKPTDEKQRRGFWPGKAKS